MRLTSWMVSAIWVAARSWRRIYDTTYRSWPARVSAARGRDDGLAGRLLGVDPLPLEGDLGRVVADEDVLAGEPVQQASSGCGTCGRAVRGFS